MASNHDLQRLAPPWIPPATGRANRSQRVITVNYRRRLWTFAATTTALWLDAGDATTVTASGGLSSQWNDKSGNSGNVTATGTARPTYTTAGLNGRNIMTFNGVTNFMSNTSAALLRGVSGATIVALLRRSANSTSEVNALAISSAAGNEGLYAGGRRIISDGFQALGASPYSPSFIIAVAIFNYSAATLTLFENGTQTANRAFSSPGITDNDAGGLIIGANVLGTGAFLNGDIAELAIIPFSAGATLRQQCEGYIAHGWGRNGSLASGHPFFTFPPYL
jgi:hypothetical protein